MLRYHLKIDPESLLTEDADGGLNFDKYFRVWGELSYCLERELTVNKKPED
jgi:hypothetical protein